jgi:filamentous hemagglutinin family protein
MFEHIQAAAVGRGDGVTRCAAPRIAEKRRAFLLGTAALFLALAAISDAVAQVRTDGSVGPPAQTLPGPNHAITPDLGQQVGGNLFHSFSTFNLATGETATFSGPNTVANIISRVTGGSPSSIDGTIKSTIAGANLFLLNPAGLMFGPNARLDVQGSFHASTADHLKFADGALFSASIPAGSSLTAAAPQAFGFLSANPAPIGVYGSVLQVPAHSDVSLVGGPIQIAGGVIQAPAGRANIVAVAGASEIGVDPAGSTATRRPMGSISMSNGASVDVTDYSGANPGGSISIRGGDIVFDGSAAARSWNASAAPGGGIVAEAGGTLVLAHGASITSAAFGSGDAGPVSVSAGTLNASAGGQIASRSVGAGRAGSVSVMADRLTIDGTNGAGVLTGITSGVFPGSTGNAGQVTVQAGTLDLLAGGEISSGTAAAGNAGRVSVTADRLRIEGTNATGFAGITSSAVFGSTGNAGEVTVVAGTVDVLAGGRIASTTASTGSAGSVSVAAGRLTIDNTNGGSLLTGITSGAFAGSTGNAGQVTVQAGTLDVLAGGEISSGTAGAGNAGRISVTADRLRIDGTNSTGSFAGITSSAVPGATGSAGAVAVTAGTLDVLAGGQIASSTAGTGHAGTVAVTADQLTIDDSANGGGLLTGINSNALAGSAGNAGTVSVHAGTLSVLAGGQISSSTVGAGDAGTVYVTADQLTVDGTNGLRFLTGIISSAVQGSTGNAGAVTVNAGTLNLLDGGEIATTTAGPGNAGSISVTANGLAVDGSNAGLALTGITSGTVFGSTGNAGQLSVQAGTLSVRAGGEISSGTAGSGRAGGVLVTADQLTVDGVNVVGAFAGVTSSAFSGSTGNAGDVTVRAGTVSLLNGGQIASASLGTGTGGQVSLLLSGDFRAQGAGSGVLASAQGANSGDAGSVLVSAANVLLADGATISSSSFGLGRGGDVTVRANDTITVTGRGATGGASRIAALSTGLADAGTLAVSADRLLVRNGGDINTSAANGAGGNLTLTIGTLLLVDHSRITTTVSGGSGSGGNIFIDPRFIVLRSGTIQANAVAGNGGNMHMIAGQFIASPDSIVQASSELGISGNITIQAPATDVTASLAELSGKIAEPPSVSRADCGAAARVEKSSSLVVAGRGGVPQDGDGAQPSTYFAGEPAGSASERRTTGAGFDATPARKTGKIQIACR